MSLNFILIKRDNPRLMIPYTLKINKNEEKNSKNRNENIYV